MLLRLDLEESQVTAWILWWLAQGGGELLTTADICFGGQAAFGHSAKASASFWHKCQNDKISAYVVSNSPVKKKVKPPIFTSRSVRLDYVKPTLHSSIRSIESISEIFERDRASGNDSCFR